MNDGIQEQINKHKRLKESSEDTRNDIRRGCLFVELLPASEEKTAQRRRGTLRLEEQTHKARFSSVMILVFMNYMGKKDKEYNARLSKELTDVSHNWIANMEEQVSSKWGDWEEGTYLELCRNLKGELDFVNLLTQKYR